MLVNGPEADAEMMARVAAFKKVMQDLGWVLGTNLRLDIRYGVNGDELREKAKELVALHPDVIMGMAPPSVIALLRVTRTIPIVFAAVTDPVGMGIVQNLACPGGNATGFLTAEFGFNAKLLELLKEAAPGIRKVIIITDLENRSAAPQFAAIQAVAPSVGVDVTLLGMNDRVSFERQIGDLARSGNGIVLFENSACTAMIGLMLIAFPSSSVNAEQPPRKGCVAVSKNEYGSAKKQKLLRSSMYGSYFRTGRIWQRRYWYCR